MNINQKTDYSISQDKKNKVVILEIKFKDFYFKQELNPAEALLMGEYLIKYANNIIHK